ncbi:MAG: helix-turn-helix transcriptional regulator [Acidobacteriota bacterium]
MHLLKKLHDPKEQLEDPSNRLTKRECEVLRLIAEGYTSKKIGEYLGISIKTVEAHSAKIKKKLSANSIAQMVQCAIVLKLIVPHYPNKNQPR